MAVGVFTNTILLLAFYWKQLSRVEDPEVRRDASPSSQKIELRARNGASEQFEDTKDNWPASPWLPFDPARLSASEKSLGSGRFETEETSQKFQSDVRPESEESVSVLVPTEHFQEIKSPNSGIPAVEMSKVTTEREQGNRIAAQEGEESCVSIIDNKTSRREYSHNILSRRESPSPVLREAESACQKRKRRAWKACVYVVTAAMLAALLYGLDLSWSALTAAAALMVLDFGDAGPNLDKVSYSLLVFFSGMFITVDGFNKTGLPGQFWNAVEPHARIDNASGIAVLALVVLLLSNFASNVPTVLLLGSRVAQSAAALHNVSEDKGWLILAWTSTVAGNLTLIGSAANLIVSEQARKAQFLGYHLSFWHHLWFGLPTTLIVVAAGLPLIPN